MQSNLSMGRKGTAFAAVALSLLVTLLALMGFPRPALAADVTENFTVTEAHAYSSDDTIEYNENVYMAARTIFHVVFKWQYSSETPIADGDTVEIPLGAAYGTAGQEKYQLAHNRLVDLNLDAGTEHIGTYTLAGRKLTITFSDDAVGKTSLSGEIDTGPNLHWTTRNRDDAQVVSMPVGNQTVSMEVGSLSVNMKIASKDPSKTRNSGDNTYIQYVMQSPGLTQRQLYDGSGQEPLTSAAIAKNIILQDTITYSDVKSISASFRILIPMYHQWYSGHPASLNYSSSINVTDYFTQVTPSEGQSLEGFKGSLRPYQWGIYYDAEGTPTVLVNLGDQPATDARFNVQDLLTANGYTGAGDLINQTCSTLQDSLDDQMIANMNALYAKTNVVGGQAVRYSVRITVNFNEKLQAKTSFSNTAIWTWADGNDNKKESAPAYEGGFNPGSSITKIEGAAQLYAYDSKTGSPITGIKYKLQHMTGEDTWEDVADGEKVTNSKGLVAVTNLEPGDTYRWVQTEYLTGYENPSLKVYNDANWTDAIAVDGNTTEGFTMVEDGIIHYATNDRLTYTVTYMPGDHGDFEPIVYNNVSYGDSAPRPNSDNVKGKTPWIFDGWNAEPATSVTENLEYTATWKIETTAVTAHKDWKDAGNADGLRPESVQVQLKADGEAVGGPITLSSQERWTHMWTGLDKYKVTGDTYKEIKYSIEELTQVQGYTSESGVSDSGVLTVTNEHVPKTSINVTKDWSDSDNAEGLRPESVTVELVRMGGWEHDVETVVGELELKASDNWTGTFEDVDKYEYLDQTQFQEAQYVVREKADQSFSQYYTSEVSGDQTEGFTITNSREVEYVEISGTKTWDDDNDRDGKRPATVTIQAKNGSSVVESREVAAPWTYKFKLQKYLNGEEATYTIDENLPADSPYSKEVTDYDVKNTYTPETVNVSVTKEWKDDSNRDGARPDVDTYKQNVTLWADGVQVTGAEAEVTANDDNTYTVTFASQPKNVKTAEGSRPIAYTVKEAEIAGYTADPTTGEVANGEIITNTHEIAKTNVNVAIAWNDEDNRDGLRDNVVVHLMKTLDGESTPSVVEGKDITFTGKTDESSSWSDLPEYENGKKITYSISAESVDGYDTPSISGSAADGFTVTLSHTPERINVTVTKTWSDDDNRDRVRPDSITVRLMNGGTEVANTTMTGSGDEWTHTFENVYKYEAGNEITYSVTEDPIEGYDASIDNLAITNTHEIEKSDLTVTIGWDDDNDRDGIRPDSFTVNLIGAGGEVVGTATVTPGEDGSWSYTFAGMPVNDQGQPIDYKIEPTETPEGYDTTTDGFTVTNTHDPEKINIQVTKAWNDRDDFDGIRPDSVDVTLVANRQGMLQVLVDVETITLCEDGEWTGTFENVYKNDSGEALGYSVVEDDVDGYEPTVTGTAADGFTITNFHAPTIVYAYTEGMGATYTKGSGTSLNFTVERNLDPETAYDHLVEIQVDGKTLDASDYVANSGSVKEELKAAYLDTLSTGDHTLTTVFDDGAASTDFTVEASATPDNPDNPGGGGKKTDGSGSQGTSGGTRGGKMPQTGDPASLVAMGALAALGASAFATGVAAKRKED